MMQEDGISASGYTEPVSQLLIMGDCRGQPEWPDYLALGLGPEQIPDLIRMVEDDKLNWADSERLEVWAPIHAWRALGQLGAEAAAEPLLGLLWRIEEFDDDWVGEEIPVVLGMIGPAAVPKVAEYLADPLHGLWARVAAAHSLAEVGQRHPGARDDCVAVLSDTLEDFTNHDPTLNGFLISFLVDLQAIEAAPLMESAFDAACVDISILGDWEDAQIALGLLEERLTPAPQYVWLPEPLAAGPRQPSQPTDQERWKQELEVERRRKGKRKAKRKQQKQARRKQRKRK
jgi:HEAT repeat protein